MDSRRLLYGHILKKLLAISGFPDREGLSSEILKNGKEAVIKEILSDFNHLNLSHYPVGERIYLIDTAVKAGNLEIVKALTEKFEKEGYADDIRIPSKDNMEHPYRPVFWLAAIVTRHLPKENYQAIEKYLCEHFKISDQIKINGKMTTRTQYLTSIDKWKHEKNIEFLGRGFKFSEKANTFVRYRRHELLDDIEKGIPLKPSKK